MRSGFDKVTSGDAQGATGEGVGTRDLIPHSDRDLLIATAHQEPNGVGVLLLAGLLDRWLPIWGAALAVTGLLALVATVLALAGRARLRRLENPLATARRRMDDHLAWWQSQHTTGAVEDEDDFETPRRPLRRRPDDEDDDEDWRIGP